MLKKLSKVIKKNQFDKTKFDLFINKNIKVYGLIPFDGDYLLHPWTEKKIIYDFKNQKSDS